MREALDEVIAVNPRLRSYVLDDAGAVRKHIAIFLNGESVHDRTGLSDPLPENGEVVACIPAIPTRRGLSRRRRTSSATRSMASRS